jgi:hypothetical protein
MWSSRCGQHAKGKPACGHQWIITTPAGFERFFALFADELARPEGPDMSRIARISEEHGITYVDAGPH